MIPSCFITGTDTGVGKTIVTASLLTALTERGHLFRPMKPVQTGCSYHDAKLDAPDLDFALKAAGLDCDASEGDLLCPYRFEPPCSPHLAASMAGYEISTEKICDCFHQAAERYDGLLVEGAGGLLVPINEQACCMIDLPRLLSIPVILVIRPGLGTLNHTLLSLEALRSRDIDVFGVVVVHAEPGPTDFIEQNNLHTIRELGQVRILADLPYVEDLDCGKPLAEQLLPLGEEILMGL